MDFNRVGLLDGEIYRIGDGEWMAIDIYGSGLIFVGHEADADLFCYKYKNGGSK